MKNSSFMRINNIFLFLCLFFLTSTSNLYAQDEFDEGIDLDFDDEEGIMWGDEESADDTFDDFFGEEDDFFTDDEESFDDLDEFLEEDEEIIEEIETVSN